MATGAEAAAVKAARRYLAMRRLQRAWRGAIAERALCGFAAAALLVIGRLFERCELIAASRLKAKLDAHGEPVRVGRRTVAIDTEAEGFIVTTRRRRPARRRQGGE